MKIPDAPILNVAPEEARVQVHPVTPAGGQEALQQGLNDAGNALGTAFKGYEEIQQKARAKVVTDGMTELHDGTTDDMYGTTKSAPVDPNAAAPNIPGMTTEEFSTFLQGGPKQTTPGFLSTRGEKAAAGLDDALRGVAKRRADIAAKMDDVEARELFLKASSAFMEETTKQAKGHAFQQLQVAADDSAKASLASTLRAVTADPSNDARSNELVASSAAAAAELATSPADAKAKEDAIRAEVASTRMDVLLERGTATDIEVAKRVFDESKHTLGEHRFAHYEGLINGKQEVSRIEEFVGGLMRINRLEDGKLDEEKIWADVGKQPGEWQRKVDPILRQHLAVERKAYDEGTEKITANAASSYLKLEQQYGAGAWGQFLNTPEAEELRVRNWKVYYQLENGSQSDLERLERKQRIHANNRAAIREQADIDKIAKNDWEYELAKDPNASLDLFYATHREVSKVMRSAFAPMQAKTIKQVETGLFHARSEFVQEATDGADGVIAQRAGTRHDKDAASLEERDFRARAGLAYDALLERKKGEPPTATEINNLKGQVLIHYMASANAKGSGVPAAVPRNADAAQQVGQDLARDLNAKAGVGAPRAAPASKVPEAARAGIVARIQQTNQTVTEDLIQRVYQYDLDSAAYAKKKAAKPKGP